MNAHSITLIVIDMDDVGIDDIIGIIENARYPNHCIRPEVRHTNTVDIGEWSDEHPLNSTDTCEAEWSRLFDSALLYKAILANPMHKPSVDLTGIVQPSAPVDGPSWFDEETP